MALKRDGKHIAPFKMRVEQGGLTQDGTFEGFASVFRELIPSYSEIVEPGAFTQTLNQNGGKVPVLWLHDPWDWIGMGQEAREETYGLYVRAKLPIADSGRAREGWALLKLANEVGRDAGLSIGFVPMKEDIDPDGIWHVREIALYEYSPCPPGFQAGPNAGVLGVRADMLIQMRGHMIDLMEEMGVQVPEAAKRAIQGAADGSNAEDLQLLGRALDTVGSILGDTVEKLRKF